MDHDYSSDEGEPVAKMSRMRPKISKTMCDEDITKLISMVESNPCIWNGSLREYSNKISRKNAWSTICQQFKGRYDENDLRAKWSNLRIQYRINATKRKGKSGHVADRGPVWRHFAALHFIGHDDVPQRQETVSNPKLEDSIDSDNEKIPDSKKYINRRCRPTHVSTETAATAIVDTMKDAVNAIKRNNDESDANLAFCKYIYTELRQMPQGQATHLRKKIMELLITADTFYDYT